MSEYYAVQRSTDHLAHYGVKGMKWGVRKAIAYGNQRALDSHFRKAAKKLAKLHDKAFNSNKYAAKSLAYGVAATGTGTLAVGGTKLTGTMLKKIGNATEKRAGKNALVKRAGHVIQRAGDKIEEWGKPNITYPNKGKINLNDPSTWKYAKAVNTNKNDLYFRLGAGAATLGLGAAAARNAYISANGRKYAEKANTFRQAMDESFSGTKYAGQYVAPPRRLKKRRKSK